MNRNTGLAKLRCPIKNWRSWRLREDKRWKYGVPPAGNANFAWVQHIIHHLAPTGVAGFLLANGSMSPNQSGAGEIRKAIIEADLVDCMVALPGQLFYSTSIPACLWFLARDKKNKGFRDRRRKVLFIDARKMGRMVDRKHRELTDEDIARVARTYHAWRGEKEAGGYEDIPGFCKSATLEEIRKHGYVLTPGPYVGAAAQEDDGEPFEEKMARLVAHLREQQAEAARLDAAIATNLKELGFELHELLRNKREEMLGLAPMHGARKERVRHEQGSARPSRPRPGVCALAGLRNVLIDHDEGVDLEKVRAIVGEPPACARPSPISCRRSISSNGNRRVTMKRRRAREAAGSGGGGKGRGGRLRSPADVWGHVSDRTGEPSPQSDPVRR